LRTVIFVLGFSFLDTVRSHWGLPDYYTPKITAMLEYVFIGAIALDIVKK